MSTTIEDKTIGIIGAGGLGETLARHLARLGYEVSISNSRGPESLAALAAETGATPVSVAEAAGASDIVIVSIPTKAVPDLPRDLFVNLPDSVIVIDTCNYHPELRDGRIDAIDRGMPDSEWVARQLGRPVIKAFNNIFASSLLKKGTPTGSPGRIALSVAGDQPDAKTAVLRLVDGLGFDPVDAGGLDESWRQQPGTAAYCQDLDAAALRRALAKAEYNRIADYRAGEEARIRQSIAAQLEAPEMTHHDFTTTISVAQTTDEAYAAILHVGGWWTGSNEGRCDEVGDEFIHRDGEAHYCKIRVTELVPGQKVAWLVLDNYFSFVEDQDEWRGTQITFEIAEAEGKTQVHFAHLGLDSEFECFDVCSNAWGSLINGSLRTLIKEEG
jgi:8-hydroxy-5-deazaflavin:NADPH oxidoreductase